MIKIVCIILLSVSIAPVFGQEKLSLVQLQTMALSGSPRLKAAEAEVEMMQKRISQSGSLDDPRVKIGVNNLPTGSFSFTKEDMTSKEIGVSQMIPLGKLGTRKEIASKEYEKAKEQLRAEKAETLHMIRMNSYELYYIRASVAILQDIKKQIDIVIDSEIAANKTGRGSLSNVIKANIEKNMVDEEIITLVRREHDAVKKIRYLAGVTSDIDIAALPEPGKETIPRDETIASVLRTNPELRMAKADEEIDRSRLSLKRAEYIPDVEIGASYMQRQNGNGMKRDDMVSGMISFNIPVWSWNKNMPMVDEMSRKHDASTQRVDDKLNDIRARTESVIAKIDSWRSLYQLYNDRMIPQTQIALETLLARYKTSAGEIMPVIDTIRILLRYRKEKIMAQTEFMSAVSELSLLSGSEGVQ